MRIIDWDWPYPKLNIIIGIFTILAGTVLWILTYKYVIPIGPIVLIICGIFLILIRNYGKPIKIH